MAKQTTSWKYVAVHPKERNPDGSAIRVEGVMKASSADLVRSMLTAERGLDPVSIEPKRSGGSETSWAKMTGGSPAVKDMAVAYRQMARLVKGGVSLPETIAAVAEGSKEVVIQEALSQIGHDLLDGTPLDEAMAKFPKVFSEIDIQLIRAAVNSGNVAQTLERIATMKEKQGSVRRKIRKAVTMPAITIVAALGAGIFLAVAMIPDLAKMLLAIDPDGQLPAPTRILLAFADMAPVLLPVLFLVGVALYFFNRRVLAYNEKWLLFRSKLALRTPVLKTLSRLTHQANLSRGLEMMLSAGVRQSEALKILAPTMSNRVFRASVEEMAEGTLEGTHLSTVMMGYPELYDFVFTKTVAFGEESGDLDGTMRNVATLTEEEVDDMAENMATTLNPLATAVSAGIVLTLVLAAFGPTFAIVQAA